MGDPQPSLLSLKEHIEKLLPHKIKLFNELTENDFARIYTPGTISHALHHDHLISQLSNSKIIPSGTSEGNFLRVHITGLEGATRLFGSYPGIQPNRSFDTGIVFSEKIEKRASWEGVESKMLQYITEPILNTMETDNYSWNMDGFKIETENEIRKRLKECKIQIYKESRDNTGSSLGRLLATPVLLRIARNEMEKRFELPIVPSLGAMLGAIENNIITPLHPGLSDIDMVILR